MSQAETRSKRRITVVVSALAAAAAIVVGTVPACGGSGSDDLVGTWLRSDDPSFVLTVSGSSGDGYELRFENTATGDSQSIGAVERPGGKIQAALMIPQEPVGALTGGPPAVVAITLSLDDGKLVVTEDGEGGKEPLELWRYERGED